MLVGRHRSTAPRGGVAPGGPEVGTSRLASYNWSGYADVSATNQTFTEVSGRWRTPRVVCSAEDTITSEWVGLDGFSSGTVEQAGTVGWCFRGTPTYFTWYEMYPAGTVEVGTSLRPGDKITATVSRRGASYTLALTDATRPAARAVAFSATLRIRVVSLTRAGGGYARGTTWN